MKDKLKSIGWTILGICILVGIVVGAFLLGGYFLDGCVWLSSQTPAGDNHAVLAIIFVAVAIVLFVLVARTNSLWLFNRWMLWGGGLCFIIGLSVVNLVDAANHHGPGFALYGDDNHDDRYTKISESQYKREKFMNYGIVLGIGVFVWIVIAMKARDEAAKTKAKEDYLEAQIKAAEAFHRAFVSSIDETSRKRAAAEAQLSDEFQEAKKAKELMWNIYYAAAKDVSGDPDYS
ncbi:MAG TPA: hypothetical protein VIK53_02800 [Verrucomicrobiae bacterium]